MVDRLQSYPDPVLSQSSIPTLLSPLRIETFHSHDSHTVRLDTHTVRLAIKSIITHIILVCIYMYIFILDVIY